MAHTTNTTTPPLVLHDAAAVLSPRHYPSWLGLALAAGAVNAGALVAAERFVTHVTGTVTRIGIDAPNGLLGVEYLLVFVAFVVGAMSSVLPLQARAMRGERPLHALPLFGVAAVLALIALAGELGAFGPLGGEVEQAGDFALLCALAFAMGLMNASVASSTALAVRTTHMTGPATDMAVSLALAWLSVGEPRVQALKLAALRGGKVVAFALGAGLMFPLITAHGYAAFALPVGAILLATLRSFVPGRVSGPLAASPASPPLTPGLGSR